MFLANRYAKHKRSVFKCLSLPDMRLIRGLGSNVFNASQNFCGALNLKVVKLIMDEIIDGNLYFIKNRYFVDFPDLNLMKNKETINGVEHNRPCFYSLKDNKAGIYWLVPVSSKIAKFESIYNKKLAKYRNVDTIVFGYVMGEKRVFLIQNMFPVTIDYIKNEYIDSATNKPVVINERLKKTINAKAKKVLTLQRKGINLIFPNVLEIEQILLEMVAQRQVAATSDPIDPKDK